MYHHQAPAAAAAAATPAATPATPAAVAGLLPQSQTYDQDWVLLSGFLIILMQVGFAFIESGSVRYKNAQSVIIKVTLGLTSTILIWWLFGYGFTFGYDGNYQFLGGTKLADAGWEANEFMNDYSNFVIRVGAAAVSVAVISGAAAERMTFLAWTILATIYSGFIYAALAHWTLAGGWLSRFGFKDFAGAGVVHFSAGIAALLTTVILKPRRFRFDPNYTFQFPAHSPVLVSFGALILYATWLFYNAGLVRGGAEMPYAQGLVAINTLIAGAAGAIFGFMVRYFQDESTSLVALSRGMITALVAVSACPQEIQAWTAFVYGLLAGVLYNVLARLIPKLHIDDPVEVISVHLGGGFLGIFLTGLFDRAAGLFYGQGMKLFGIQLLGLLIIALWVGFFVVIVLLGLKGFGLLRVSSEVEGVGLDKSTCLGEATVYANQSEYPVEVEKPKLVDVVPSSRRGNQSIFDPARSGFR